MVEIKTFSLIDIIAHTSKPSSARLCRVYYRGKGEPINSYILPAQAVILSEIANKSRKLSLAEKCIMGSCPRALFSLEGKDLMGTATDEAINANYEFVW